MGSRLQVFEKNTKFPIPFGRLRLFYVELFL